MKIKYICEFCSKEFINFDWRNCRFCSRGCRSKSLISSKLENAYNWKGEDVQYNSLHRWVQRNLGKGKYCLHCGKKGEKNGRKWNLDWANSNGKYERNLNSWIPLCRKCHISFDKNIEKRLIYVEGKPILN